MSGRSRAQVLAAVRRVIGLEAQTLVRLRASVGAEYALAVGLILRCRGKVVVTGMGKSGLIAQKVAATFSSTGTPALYLHPAEGMHGDLGIIQARDLIIAIAKSGESQELNGILPSLRRLKVKLVAITANPDSTLGRSADVVLMTPVSSEACPLNLAPTCSTTAALAGGDALAVALMGLRGFRKEHFASLHPGGQLGRRLTLTVRDIMRKGPDNPTVPEDASLSEMLVQITRKHAGAVSVVDGRGRLRGLVTDYDIRRALEQGADFSSLTIPHIMNPTPIYISEDLLAVEAVQLMSDRRHPFNVLPVVDRRKRAVGLVQIHDVRALGL